MPIFSSNRVSYGGSYGVVADTRYTENDFGRIMQECAINDMRIFNAALARDFKEIQATNEGTMLESELKAFQEFSVKEAWNSLKGKVKKLWAKIKGVFKTVYAKLTLWLVKYNKAYIALHRKELLNKNCSACKIPKYRDRTEKYIPVTDWVDKYKTKLGGKIRFNGAVTVDAINNINVNELSDDVKAVFGADIKEPTVSSASDVYDKYIKANFSDTSDNLTFGNCYYKGSVNSLLTNLSTNASSIKGLKKDAKKIDQAFKSLLGKIDKAKSKAETDKNEASTKVYTNMNKIVSACQTGFSNTSNAAVRAVKFEIKNDRGLVSTLVAYDPKKSVNDQAWLLESAYMEGFDALCLETDDMSPEDVEAEADAEGIDIEITVSGGDDVDVEVNDETGDE